MLTQTSQVSELESIIVAKDSNISALEGKIKHLGDNVRFLR
jgi:hypothetical protein